MNKLLKFFHTHKWVHINSIDCGLYMKQKYRCKCGKTIEKRIK